MSGSFPVFDAAAAHLVARLAPRRALDIGAGSGKYGRLLEQQVPACERVAVEVDAACVERFGLRGLYRRVDLADAARWWRDNAEESFDLVILGDCLQSMAKSEGQDLLNALVYRAAWLLVVVPEFVVQGVVDGASSSVHRSAWSERDLHWHDLWAWDNVRSTTLLLLRGYLPATLPLEQVVQEFNAAHVPLMHFDGQAVVRPGRLRLVDHAREVAYRPR